jgi:integrase
LMAVTRDAGLTTKAVEGSRLVDCAFAAGKQIEVRDNGRGGVLGLILRVTPMGTRTWSVQYVRKSDGVKRRVTIGTFPEFSLDQARTAARAIREVVARGEDPAAKIEPVAVYTFNMLADTWLKRHAERNKAAASVYDDRLLLEKDVRPAIGAMAADAVKKSDVGRILDAIVERNSPIRANRALALIRSVFGWGMRRDLVLMNPAVGIDMPSNEVSRDRVLSDTEVVAFWRGLDSAPMSKGTRLAMKLSLATAQRIGQISLMGKRELDMSVSAPVWIAPGSHTKNGEPNRTPLSPLAVRLIEEALQLGSESAFVFPAPGGEAPMNPKAATRAMTRARKGFGIDHFTVHDLRRTAASNMAALGISPDTIARVLDHISVTRSSITMRVYVKHSFDAEKRRALETWAERLEALVNDDVSESKVVEGIVTE